MLQIQTPSTILCNNFPNHETISKSYQTKDEKNQISSALYPAMSAWSSLLVTINAINKFRTKMRCSADRQLVCNIDPSISKRQEIQIQKTDEMCQVRYYRYRSNTAEKKCAHDIIEPTVHLCSKYMSAHWAPSAVAMSTDLPCPQCTSKRQLLSLQDNTQKSVPSVNQTSTNNEQWQKLGRWRDANLVHDTIRAVPPVDSGCVVETLQEDCKDNLGGDEIGFIAYAMMERNSVLLTVEKWLNQLPMSGRYVYAREQEMDEKRLDEDVDDDLDDSEDDDDEEDVMYIADKILRM